MSLAAEITQCEVPKYKLATKCITWLYNSGKQYQKLYSDISNFALFCHFLAVLSHCASACQELLEPLKT